LLNGERKLSAPEADFDTLEASFEIGYNSGMAIRGVQEQSIHDQVVGASASTYTKMEESGYKVSSNPNGYQNQYVGPRTNPQYPDVVVWYPSEPGSTGGTAHTIEEIETEGSVNEEEASQWAAYAALNVVFRLIVPTQSAPEARRILDNQRLTTVELWTWEKSIDGRINFRKYE